MPGSELTRRVIVAVVGIPVVLAAVYLGGWALGALLALIALAAALELYRLASRSGVEPFVLLGSAAAVGFVAVATARPAPAAAAPGLWWITMLLLLSAAAVSVRLRQVERRPLEAVAVTVAGALLAGGSLSFVAFLRHLEPGLEGGAGPAWVGTALVGFPLVIVWVNDTGAFAIGRRWGRRRLSPRISPGKTVEGAVAGVAASILAGALYAGLAFHGVGLDVGLLAGAAGGALVGAAGQVGDLAESLLKRQAGVKDSGRMLPGHGGVLDRLDALIFGIPLAYLYLSFVLPGGAGGPP